MKRASGLHFSAAPGIIAFAALEVRHAIESVCTHFGDCHSAIDFIGRVRDLDEATFLGVVAFGVTLVVMTVEYTAAVIGWLGRLRAGGIPPASVPSEHSTEQETDDEADGVETGKSKRPGQD